MKKIGLILFVVLVAFSCSNKKKNDWDRMNLKGKVQSIREISYQAEEKFGDFSEERAKLILAKLKNYQNVN